MSPLSLFQEESPFKRVSFRVGEKNRLFFLEKESDTPMKKKLIVRDKGPMHIGRYHLFSWWWRDAAQH